MMENRNDIRFIATIQMPLNPATPVQAVLSVNGSLRKIVREMRDFETPYQDAIREFQARYVVAVLVKHACHLGKTAASSTSSELTPGRFDCSFEPGAATRLRSIAMPIRFGIILAKA
jgi:hypothetical protein